MSSAPLVLELVSNANLQCMQRYDAMLYIPSCGASLCMPETRSIMSTRPLLLSLCVPSYLRIAVLVVLFRCKLYEYLMPVYSCLFDRGTQFCCKLNVCACVCLVFLAVRLGRQPHYANAIAKADVKTDQCNSRRAMRIATFENVMWV